MSEEQKAPVGWGDPIEDNANDKILPEGAIVAIEVLNFRRQYGAWGKLGNCNIAEIEIRAKVIEGESEGEEATFRERIALHSTLSWLIFRLFTSLGLREAGSVGEFVPPWSKLIGAKGRGQIKHRTWTGRNGISHKENEIAVWLAPGEAPRARETAVPPAEDNLAF